MATNQWIFLWTNRASVDVVYLMVVIIEWFNLILINTVGNCIAPDNVIVLTHLQSLLCTATDGNFQFEMEK